MAAPMCLSGGELGHVAEVAFLHLPGQDHRSHNSLQNKKISVTQKFAEI